MRKKFDVKKTEMCQKETFPKERVVNLVNLDKNSLHSPPVAEVLESGEENFASL